MSEEPITVISNVIKGSAERLVRRWDTNAIGMWLDVERLRMISAEKLADAMGQVLAYGTIMFALNFGETWESCIRSQNGVVARFVFHLERMMAQRKAGQEPRVIE